MEQLNIVLKNEKIDINLTNIKIVLGSDFRKIDRVKRIIKGFINKEGRSESAQEFEYINDLLIDNDHIYREDYQLFYLNSDYDLTAFLKGGNKSILLSFLELLLKDLEYTEEYQTISILYDSMSELVNERLKEVFDCIRLEIVSSFDKKQYIKSLICNAKVDEYEINDIDIGFEEQLEIQLKIVDYLAKKLNKKVICFINVNYLTNKIYKLLENEMKDVYYVVFTNKFEMNDNIDANDFFIIERSSIDLSDDNQIYDAMLDANTFVSIKEYKINLVDYISMKYSI